MGEKNRRGLHPRPYSQWGMEAPRLVSTGKYRADSGLLEDFYLIKPHGNGLLAVGMTIADLAASVAAGLFAAFWLWLMAQGVGIGIDGYLDKMGW